MGGRGIGERDGGGRSEREAGGGGEMRMERVVVR